MSGRQIVKDVDTELMIYKPDEDLIHFLNPTARKIYKLYQQGLSPQQMIPKLSEEFDIPPSRNLLEDIHKCLEELRKKALI